VRIARTERFKKAWADLDKPDKALARKAIINLSRDIRYPALKVKKIKGVEGIWEARVSLSLRMTFQIEGDVIFLRNVGRHDSTLNSP
jgi:mRNA interferase RelE/StbE